MNSTEIWQQLKLKFCLLNKPAKVEKNHRKNFHRSFPRLFLKVTSPMLPRQSRDHSAIITRTKRVAEGWRQIITKNCPAKETLRAIIKKICLRCFFPFVSPSPFVLWPLFFRWHVNAGRRLSRSFANRKLFRGKARRFVHDRKFAEIYGTGVGGRAKIFTFHWATPLHGRTYTRDISARWRKLVDRETKRKCSASASAASMKIARGPLPCPFSPLNLYSNFSGEMRLLGE